MEQVTIFFSPLEGAPSFIHQCVPIAPAHWEILNHIFKQLIVGSADICESHWGSQVTEFKAKIEVLKELIILANKWGHQKEPQLLTP